MGKNNRKKSSYVHNHTYNPNAHESNERKSKLLKNLEIKRCFNILNKIRSDITCYLPIDVKLKQNKPIDKNYKLKGGAAVAQQYYLPSDYSPPQEPVDLLEQYHGKLYSHEEGMKFLIAMKDYGIALHNIGSKTYDAIEIFEEMLELDQSDNLNVKEHLLRCYMSQALGDKARELINRYSDHKSCMFVYTLSLLDYISLLINEEGSSIKLANQTLKNAINTNKFVIFIIAYNNYFDLSNVIDSNLEIKQDNISYDKSENTNSFDELLLLDAIKYSQNDLLLWIETENAIEWLVNYINDNKLLDNIMNEVKTLHNDDDNTIHNYTSWFIDSLEVIYNDIHKNKKKKTIIIK